MDVVADPGGFTTAPDNPAPLRHIAVIPDGNRRWAARHGLPTVEGYRRGSAKAHEFLGWCAEAGIPMVTLWLLSTENLHRDRKELRGLLPVIVDAVDLWAADGRWRLRLLGDLDALPRLAASAMQAAADRTRHVEGVALNIAVAYGGRSEIVHALRRMLAEHAAAGTLHSLAATLGSDDIADRLYTAGQPDPDLVIRTSGEQRLSGFMPWQAAYSEFYFCDTYWPGLTKADFAEILRSYAARVRRFGQ
ncbi:di-trans,poly-cis-decaprenylcistransferase [Inquilinus limosus]|uniref:polyprenyl diphosphate synthase n=1 Tax=Inquilinus limosus TaxID=171674 RepID=UPI003F14CD7A